MRGGSIERVSIERGVHLRGVSVKRCSTVAPFFLFHSTPVEYVQRTSSSILSMAKTDQGALVATGRYSTLVLFKRLLDFCLKFICTI